MTKLKIGSSSCPCSTTSIGRFKLQIHQMIQDKREACQTSPEESKDRIIFMSMFNDIDWKVKNYARRFPLGHWSFLGPGEKDKVYGTRNDKPEGKWNVTADLKVRNFEGSGNAVLRATSALDRGFLRKKSGRCTIRFSAEPSNAELSFRTNH